MLEAVAPVDNNDNLPFLIDHFEELGPHGLHLCFVVPPLSTDLGSFRRSAPNGRLPLHTVKITLLCVLQALERLHRINIIHTGSQFSLLAVPSADWSLPLSDIKPDNILFNIGEDAGSLESDLAADPPQVVGEVELNGTSYQIMHPQPLPHTFAWDDAAVAVELYDFVLNDLGQGVLAIL